VGAKKKKKTPWLNPVGEVGFHPMSALVGAGSPRPH